MISYQQLQNWMPSESAEPDWRALWEGLPDLQSLAITPQDPYYHAEGDVWTHTKMVVNELLAGETYQQANAEQRFVLFYAALLHDIAKPATTIVRPDGGVGSPRHSRRGAVDARILLWRAGVPFALRERICRIIAQHQVPFFIFDDRAQRRPEFLAHRMSWEVSLQELYAVALADMSGRTYEKKADSIADIALFRELALQESCWEQPRVFPDETVRQQYFRSDGATAADYGYQQPEGSEVVVLCGLPASGKNTWASRHRPDWPTVSYDDAREEMGLKYGQNEGKVAHHAIDMAKEHLRRKQPFVWNATHLSQEMRSNALDLLYAYHAKIRIVYLEAGEKTLRARNRKRDSTVTDKVIDRLLYRWEIPLPSEAHWVEYVVED
ncbi:AAA family ATPase [Hahella aquimaris]|uniref:AAA family ATPase n=1 Tax=Hahella sp. HNIBRBA332 TaxID=3015983 RepID=UPI00273A7A31|nr:AAA family ATPase [Hahella sp. HNIBRBA332]WLQ13101.1 AAA family ATPase [Hahella sp. HNIBRBA332]